MRYNPLTGFIHNIRYKMYEDGVKKHMEFPNTVYFKEKDLVNQMLDVKELGLH